MNVPLRYLLAILVLLQCMGSNAQQIIVPANYPDPSAFQVFDRGFLGKVIVICKDYREANGVPRKPKYAFDTSVFIAEPNLLYDSADTSKLNLNDLFEGLFFDLRSNSKIVVTKQHKKETVFDTAYSYNGIQFKESTIYFQERKAFIMRQQKEGDSMCNYLVREFNDTFKLTAIYYCRCQYSEINDEALLSKLKTTYCGHYFKLEYNKKFPTLVSVIKYYRRTADKRSFYLNSKNEYYYAANRNLTRSLFSKIMPAAKTIVTSTYQYSPRHLL